MKQSRNDRIVIVDNDAECMRILTDAGLMNAIEKGANPDSNVTWLAFKYRDYYCIGSYWSDFAESKDNGFTIVMLPKADFNAVEAASMFTELRMETSIPTEHTRFGIIDPKATS